MPDTGVSRKLCRKCGGQAMTIHRNHRASPIANSKMRNFAAFWRDPPGLHTMWGHPRHFIKAEFPPV
jgi:hypothetical protein